MKFNEIQYKLILMFICVNSIVLAQTPFTCNGEFYISIYGSGATTILNEVEVLPNGTATFTPVSPSMPFRINSIGYRVTDNLIYGLHPSNNQLYNIDATGIATSLGTVTLNNNNNYVAGDVTPDGNYLVVIGKAQNNPNNELVKIDLNSPTFTTTSIPLIDAATGLPNSTVNIADIAFNPITGILYAYDGNNQRLVTIDENTGAINSALYPSLLTTNANGLGAVFFDPLGQLWGYGRQLSTTQQQDLFFIDITTGTTTYITSGPVTNGNDGCSCPYIIDMGKAIAVDTILPCETFEIIYPISNLTGTIQSGINFVDTLPIGFSIQQINNNPFGGIVSGIGTNQLNINNLNLPLGIDSLIITVQAASTLNGYYGGHGHLKNLPTYLGDSIISDNPTTFLVDDETGITIIPMDLGTDIVTCDASGITIGLDSISPLNGLSFLWNTTATTPTINVNQSNDYILNISNGTCLVSDTINVAIINSLSVNLGNDTTICESETLILDATVPNISNYLWQDGSTNATFTTNIAGIYWVEIGDTANCTARDTIIITNQPQIPLDLGNDTTICNQANILLDATQNDVIYQWQDGSVNPIFTASTIGTYFVTLTDTFTNCMNTDTILISVASQIDLGIDQVFHCDSTTFTVYPNVQTGSFLWSDNSTNLTYIATQPKTISVIYSDANNCTSYDTITLSAPTIPPIDLGVDTVICGNATYTLSIFNTNQDMYLWQDGSTNSTFTVNEAGIYSAEITDANGCSNSDTITVDYFLNENLDLGNDTTICESNNFQINLNIENAISYEWQDGTTTADYTISNAGMYWVTIMNINNCMISDTILVDTEVAPSEIIGLPTDTIMCKNTTITLRAFAQNATNYLWQGESAFYEQNDVIDTTFLVTYSGEYSLTASNSCAGITQQITVTEEDCGCYPYVPNAFTPNNDGRNDAFQIFANCPIENYQLSIFDRWGNRVFLSTDVNETWDGTIQGKTAITGVYVWQMIYQSTNEKGVLVDKKLSGDLTLVL